MERLYGQMEANPRNEPGSHKMRLKEHLNPFQLTFFLFSVRHYAITCHFSSQISSAKRPPNFPFCNLNAAKCAFTKVPCFSSFPSKNSVVLHSLTYHQLCSLVIIRGTELR